MSAEESDRYLVLQAKTGDKTAFEKLAVRYQPLVFERCRRWSADYESARELTQETMLQAFLSLDHLRDVNNFRGWLAGIARNLCRMYWRSHVDMLSLDALLDNDIPDDDTAPDKVAEDVVMQEIIREAVNTLPALTQEAVRLYYFAALSTVEASDFLGISEGAFRVRLFRARKQLHERLYQLVQPSTIYQNGENSMIPVTIADVIERTVDEASGHPRILYQVILLDEVSRRALILWMGTEGLTVAMKLLNVTFPRPRSQLLTLDLLEHSGGYLTAVEIARLQNDTYYATIRFIVGEEIHEMDARPGDAIALAVHSETPIYVHDDVLKKTGFNLSGSYALKRGGLAQIEATLQAEYQRMEAHEKRIRAKPNIQRSEGEQWDQKRVLQLAFGIGRQTDLT